MKLAWIAIPLISSLLTIPTQPAQDDPARPDLVREVLAGKRSEARASWWGFDARDSTAFLQRAIDSKVRKLIIDRQESPWIARPLTGVSDQEIVFEEGTELIALKGAYRPKGDCLLTFRECRNVIVRGEKADGGLSARIRMHKADYQSDAYDKSEWRHGLVFIGCRNVLVQDLAVEQTGGDGIYLGTTSGKIPNRNVVIRRVDCNDNHRQGISVISAVNLLIEDCRLRNTRGTAPQAGIDFEPNSPDDRLINCVMRRCTAEGNAGTGFQICPQSMNGSSKPLSIILEDCVSRGNRQHSVHLVSAQQNPPAGLLRITRLIAENDAMAGLSVQFNPFDAVHIEMEDSVLRNCARNDSFFPPIYVQGLSSDTRPAGGIRFRNVTVEDDVDRLLLKVRARPEDHIRDISGSITLKRRGRTEAIDLQTWLTKHYPQHVPVTH